MTQLPSDSLLTVLHRWASRQDENFITDSFAHLLRRLLRDDTAVGIEIIRQITDGQFNVELQDAKAVAVSTQVSISLGRPDIEISALGQIIYVESKVESGLGDRQLHRYLDELDSKTDVSIKVLVLLSRYPIDIGADIANRVVRKRWYQIADILVEKLDSACIKDTIDKFLVEQFVDFLRARNITMARISWELPNGVTSLRSLVAMLDEAIAAVNCPRARSAAWDWIGYYLVEAVEGGNNRKPFFVGVYFDRPALLVFETNEVAVIANAMEVAGFGRVVNDRYKPGGTKWVNELVLDSEDVHFFALSRERQMQAVEQFLHVSIEAANHIRV